MIFMKDWSEIAKITHDKIQKAKILERKQKESNVVNYYSEKAKKIRTRMYK